MLQLKAQLLDVIKLTQDLLTQAKEETTTKPTSSTASTKDDATKDDDNNNNNDDPFAVGKTVQAIWSGDNEWYPATISEILLGGEFKVVFDGYGDEEVVSYARKLLLLFFFFLSRSTKYNKTLVKIFSKQIHI